MRRTRRNSRREGLTLIEVMLALGMLGAGLLTLAVMQLEAARGGRSGRVDTVASAVAQDQMERLNRQTWTNLTPTSWTTPLAQTTQGQDFQLSWRIADVVANWTRAIDVRVTWDGPQRANRRRVLSSIRYNRENL